MDTGWLIYLLICGGAAVVSIAIFGWQMWQRRRKRLLRASACPQRTGLIHYGSGIYLPDPQLVAAWIDSLLPPPDTIEARALGLLPHLPTREEIEAEIRRRQQM